MALIGRFIGVDKHSDPLVPDLAGACRDAKALWALFTDTFADKDLANIVDEEATLNAIREALKESFGNASSNDFVVFAFSGHGTRDHRLVTYDTEYEKHSETTISMAELADHFKKSKAKSILCLLDCCFSGGATARVLHDTPLSRDLPVPFDSFTGDGRVLVTASHLDEPAYEHPKRRHGLLTDAFIQTLTEATRSMGIASAMDKVMSLVRANAISMGCTQTPIFFGAIEGGLTLAPLQKGQNFRNAFPEYDYGKISPLIGELSFFGLPKPILEEWETKFPDGLNELQLSAVNDHGVLNGHSLIVVAPTSAGKTFIGEIAAIKAITEGKKAIFLLPFKALVNEKYDQFLSSYGDNLGLKVIRCTGDYSDQTGLFVNSKFDIAILTYEMFLSLAITNPQVPNRIGIIVLDEAQFIADPSRGIIVELILTHLRVLRNKEIEPQLITLSATIGNLNAFDQWLGVTVLKSENRPVPLEFGVIDRHGIFEYLDEDGKADVNQLLPGHLIRQRRDKPSSQDVIVPLTKHLLGNVNRKEKILIFRNHRGASEGCALYLAKELSMPPAISVLDALPSFDTSSVTGKLRQALNGGTAFHNTNLTREERVSIENAFRDPDGPVHVLSATTTVAAGINTPASTVLIVETSFPWENRAFTIAEVQNMAGRAGRLGFRETGRAIIIAENSIERKRLFQKYIQGSPEPISSSFQQEHIGTWIIRLLAQVDRVEVDQVVSLLANTYGGFLANIQNPEWVKNIDIQLSSLLPKMISLNLLEQNDAFVQLTLLGRICGQSSLGFESALRLVAILKEHANRQFAPIDLLILVQSLPEMDEQYIPIFKRGQREAAWPQKLMYRQGGDLIGALQKKAPDMWTYYSRAKRACVANDWADGVPTESIEKAYSVTPYQTITPGAIRAIADATRWHLRSAFEITTVAIPQYAPNSEGMDELLCQLEFGIPVQALGLLDLPIALTRGEYLSLHNAGLNSPNDVWKLPKERLKNLISKEQLEKLEQLRPIR